MSAGLTAGWIRAAPATRRPGPGRPAGATALQSAAGVTLLELLIAATIMALLALAIMTTMQVSLQLWSAERAAASTGDAAAAVRQRLLGEIGDATNVWIQDGVTPGASDQVALQLPLVSPSSPPALGAIIRGASFPGDWVLYRVEGADLRRHHTDPSLAILDGAGELIARAIASGGLQATKDPATGVVTVQVGFAGSPTAVQVTLAAYPARDDNTPPETGPGDDDDDDGDGDDDDGDDDDGDGDDDDGAD